MKDLKFILIIPILFIAYVNCYGQTEQGLEEDIKVSMNKYRGVGISAVVVKNNKIIYTKSFGYNPDYNNKELRKPIPINGVYVIASISKSFVSTAIMQLVEEKKLKLDDDINKYLTFNVRNPQFPNVPITVRMLLCHRSSLNDNHYAWNLNQINPNIGKRWKECYNDYAPGRRYKYCNLGYSLLGAIIENVTKERFPDYIDNHIIKPLSLNASYNLTKIDSNLLVKSLSYDHKLKKFRKCPSIYNYSYFRKELKKYRIGYSAAAFSPTGGMKISAPDLARYMLMHMNYGIYNGIRIVTKNSEMEMRTPPKGNKNYALAFSKYHNLIEGEILEGMSGCAHGVHSTMAFNSNEKYGFVVICNGCTSNPTNGQDLNREIIKILYKHLIKNKITSNGN